MSLTVGAKTKGWIKNNDTGELMNFQFNPENFSYSRGVVYSEIIAPGQSYPLFQFVSGKARTFPLKLYIYDRPKSTGLIIKYMKFIGGFLTPETNTDNYIKPPTMTFAYGYFIRKCVMDNLDINIIDMGENGEPIEAEFNLEIRQVSP